MTSSVDSHSSTETTREEKKIHIAIDNKLYDLAHFADVHPGGRIILKDFDETDASEPFYAIHSQNAVKMLENLKRRDLAPEERLPKKPYFKLAAEMEAGGFFKPNYFIETLLISHTLILYFVAVLLNEERPFLACIALGIATMSGGWVGHHLDHSRDSPLRAIGNFYSPLLTGFSPSWWSNKHNRHHVSCNETGNDGDIQLMPFIYLWMPERYQDRWNRRFQHLYFGILYTILHMKWQYDSVNYAIRTRHWREIYLLSIHFLLYAILFKVKVVLFGVLISGTITAFIVTANHQAEEKITSKRDLVETNAGQEVKSRYEINDYAKQQLLTTRNITTYNW
eukprot:CAMPEP_0176425524 /NCGR_PEP_ID=MMETSP0127-20121128/11437_1 /TAXON_ID=938130 /ORGANISM="Platyophrya macrostoma, Strain WH" /LENGTH=337 /DNA_ID=CAMNT_0017806695 /DNA_START=20 /DNA_END=1030 /DNA_ORIENTATION=-